MMRVPVKSSAAMLLVLLCGSCGSAPVSNERLTQENRRFLQPFLNRMDVGCEELVIEMTANFVPCVSVPTAVPNLHQMTKSRTDQYTETRWVNLTGSTDHSFLVTVGERGDYSERGPSDDRMSRFQVVRAVTIRVFEGTRALTLDVRSGGRAFMKEAAATRELREFQVTDGALQIR